MTVEGRDRVVLDGLVRQKIKRGWQPFGGIAVGPDGHCFVAMVKYAPTEYRVVIGTKSPVSEIGK